jgi:hypothetical protein
VVKEFQDLQVQPVSKSEVGNIVEITTEKENAASEDNKQFGVKRESVNVDPGSAASNNNVDVVPPSQNRFREGSPGSPFDMRRTRRALSSADHVRMSYRTSDRDLRLTSSNFSSSLMSTYSTFAVMNVKKVNICSDGTIEITTKVALENRWMLEVRFFQLTLFQDCSC